RLFEFGQLIDERRRLDGRLAVHVLRSLVVAESEIDGMPELLVVRPLGEADLRDELRLDPVRPLVGLDRVAEGRRLDLERRQETHHARELALVESRADVSDVLQAALTAIVVDAEQQRAEVRARLAR